MANMGMLPPQLTSYATMMEFLLNQVKVSLNFAVAPNGGGPELENLTNSAKRSDAPTEPPLPPSAQWWIDSICFGNSGYRYDISSVLKK